MDIEIIQISPQRAASYTSLPKLMQEDEINYRISPQRASTSTPPSKLELSRSNCDEELLNIPQYLCELCFLPFPTPSELENHQTNQHKADQLHVG